MPISWDDALDEIAGKLRAIAAESGPEAVAFAFTSPSASGISDSIDWLERFVWTFGSPNICYATELCNWHKDYAHAFTYGVGIGVPDYRHSDLIVLWGHNPPNVWLAQAEAITAARRRGARLVVIDPRRTALAREADLWLRVRPGTDGVLALAVARQLIETQGYDASFVRRWTNAPLLVRLDNGRLLRAEEAGIGPAEAFVVWDVAVEQPRPYEPARAIDQHEAFRLQLDGTVTVECKHGPIACRPVFALYRDLLASFTPERVAAISGVSADLICAFAKALSATPSVAYYCWTGVGQHANATQTDRAIAVLFALKGQFDAPGGNMYWATHPIRPISDYGMLAPEQRAKALGLAERPIGPPSQGWITAADLYRAALTSQPYRVRALVSFGANLLISHPDTATAHAALRSLDFQVHCDLFLNPTSVTADIVLPVNTPFEREGLRVGFEISAAAQELVQLRQPALASVGESRSDMEIVFALAHQLGLPRFFGGDRDRALDHVLEPSGLDVAELRRHPEGVRRALAQRVRKYADPEGEGVRGFSTLTRRVEIYSERLLVHGQSPLPHPEAVEATSDSFPFVLTTAKNGYFCHSQHRGIPSLRRRSFFPRIDLSATIAQARAIRTDDVAEIRTAHGRIRMRARIDEALAPDVAVAEYGWWDACPDIGAPAYVPLTSTDANYNTLASSADRDPISGVPRLRSLACDVRLVGSVRAWDGLRQLEVVGAAQEGAGIVSLELAARDRTPLPSFHPGQFISLRLDSCEGATRLYSLSSAPAGDRYRITVKRVAGGSASNHLASPARVGDALPAQAPAGRFRLPLENTCPVVLAAGGIGITPFMSLLETLASRGGGPQIILHYAVRNGSEHAFKARITQLAGQLGRFQAMTWYSQPLASDVAGRDFDKAGRISADDLLPLLLHRPRFYLCGPAAMMDELSAGLIARGVPPFEIFTERFRSPVPKPVADGGVRKVHFRRSGALLEWTSASGTILDLAEKSGVRVPTGCRVGQCESCVVPLLEGSVDHIVAADEIAEGQCRTCQAVPATDVVLDA